MGTRRGNNEGCVYKDKQGHWRGVVSLPSSDGKYKKKCVYGRTRKEATDKMNEILTQLRTNSYIEPCKMTLYEWLCTWLDEYCNDIRMTTKINYETYTHQHIKDTIGGYKLCDLSPMVIQQFYNEKAKNGKVSGKGGLSPKTLRNLHNFLHKALNQAVFLEMIAKNPTESTVLPKRQKVEMRYFTVDEQKLLQAAIKGHRLEMPILIVLYTGIRQGELLGLTWDNVHIDLQGQSYINIVQTLNRIQNKDKSSPTRTLLVINEPKTKHSIRTIPLLPDIAKHLAEYKEEQAIIRAENGFPDNGFVFTSTVGTPVDPRCLQRDFKKILVKNGIRVINVHGLRHTFATRALESGMSVKTLSKILGHSSVGFTLDTYAHVTERLKVSEISGMQGFL